MNQLFILLLNTHFDSTRHFSKVLLHFFVNSPHDIVSHNFELSLYIFLLSILFYNVFSIKDSLYYQLFSIYCQQRTIFLISWCNSVLYYNISCIFMSFNVS